MPSRKLAGSTIAWRSAATGATSGRRPGRVAARARPPPSAAASARRSAAGVGTGPAEERRQVEQRVADAAVAPVEEHRAAVDQRTLPGWKSPWTSTSGRPHSASAAKRAGSPSTQPPQRRRRRRPGASRATTSAARRRNAAGAPVGHAEGEQLARPRRRRRPAGRPARRPSPPAARAWRPSSPGRARRPAACGPARRRPAAAPGARRPSAAEHQRLVGEERRHVLQPHRPAGRREAPDRREVPRLHLHRRPGEATMPRRPRQVGGRAAGPGVRQAEGIVVGQRAGHGESHGDGSPPASSAR